MCGIVGWAFEPGLTSGPEQIEAATRTLERRGPDGCGTWFTSEGKAALGHRRLSVLDITPSGSQPMTSRNGRFVISFNGEIYNHLSLRERLESEGAAPAGGWSGTSDTETLLAAISAWGLEDALQASIGMFAIGLWDTQERSLSLARDRFGEKPLYVARLGSGLGFASELKALMHLPQFDRAIDPSALGFFLGHGYIQAPATIFARAAKLLPGTYVTLTEEDVKALPRTGDFLAAHRRFYWRLIDEVRRGMASPFQGTEEEAVEQLERVLSTAVKQQQIADVPLGAFLSGGIDSSTIVALMQASGNSRVQTYTIGFFESDYDESGYAEAVANHLGVDHTTVHLSASDALERVDGLAHIWDEPFADVSQLPMLLLSEVTRRSVTVALSGDGGDELFGGYERYSWAEAAWSKLRKVPRPLRRAVATAARVVPPSGWDRAFRLLPREVRSKVTGDRFHKISALLPAEDAAELYDLFLTSWRSEAPLLEAGNHPHAPHWSGYPDLPELAETLMFRDAVDYLTDDVLAKVDRAAMSVGLETRAPLLDPNVVGFAWSLPLEFKRRAGRDKIVLRKLLHKYVPAELVERPKAGFAVPLDEWLRGPMRDWAESHLSNRSLTASGLNAQPIRRAWEAHLAGTENHRYFLWNVLTYQAWRAYHFPSGD